MKKIAISLFSLLVLMGQGCGGGLSDGGIFVSFDGAATWEQRVITTDNGNISNTNIVEITFDPNDSQVVYIGTRNQGAFRTSNQGESWQPFFTDRGRVQSLAISPQNSNDIYVSIGGKIYKTNDDGGQWRLIYNDAEGGNIIDIQIDGFQTSRLFAGLDNGVMLRSEDSGNSWQRIAQFDGDIAKVLVNPRNTSIIYAATLKKGIYKSSDSGNTWVNLKENYDDFKNADTFRYIALDLTKNDGLIYANEYGVLRSFDGGRTWNALPLLTAPNSVGIYSVAVSPTNDREVYYTTETNIYKSVDGGNTWSTSLLPTGRIANALVINPNNSNNIYIGALRLQQSFGITTQPQTIGN